MTGTLGLFSLVDLFQLLAGAGRTGRLKVEHPKGDAKVYFEAGEVVHAIFGDLAGVDAVYALFADERGQFTFTSGLPALDKSIEMGTQNLVLEAVRQLDESRRDNDDDVALEPDMVPERNDEVDAATVKLGAPEVGVLGRIDGRRSVQRLADASGISVVETSRIVARLVAAGVVVVRKRRPRTARLVVRPAGTKLPAGTAAIDPSIVEAWTRSLGRRPEAILCRREDGTVDRLQLMRFDAVGPYLMVGRATLLRTGLETDQPLLVRPVEEDG